MHPEAPFFTVSEAIIRRLIGAGPTDTTRDSGDGEEGAHSAGREVLAEQTIAALGLQHDDSPELRALVRGYGGLVQETILEWLVRRRLTKSQVREILMRSMPMLLEHVRPHLSSEPGS